MTRRRVEIEPGLAYETCDPKPRSEASQRALEAMVRAAAEMLRSGEGDDTPVLVRICPLGPPQSKKNPDGSRRPVAYAYCPECKSVRKSTKDCPMIAAQNRAQQEGP